MPVVLSVLSLVIALAALLVGVLAWRRPIPQVPTSVVEVLPEDVQGLRQEVAALRAEGAGAFRHLSIVRYDAHSDMGGQLSWSMALLDDSGDGVVVTSIHSRAEARTYAKAITKHTSEQPLSPEEAEAVEHAR